MCAHRLILVDGQVRSEKQEATQDCSIYWLRSLRYECDLLSTDVKIRSAILQHNTKLCGRCKIVFAFESYFQMDIDLFQGDFADQDGYVPGYKLAVESVRTEKTLFGCSWQRA